MVATDFGNIMRFFRNASVTMVTIEFFLDSITKIWFYQKMALIDFQK